MSNSLSEGIVGRELIKHFEEIGDGTPVWAELVRVLGLTSEVVDYRITFDDGRIENHRVTFAPGYSYDIVRSAYLP